VSEDSERWLPVPEFEGLYEVSDHGRVRSLDRQFTIEMPGGWHTASGPTTRTYKGRVLRPNPRGPGGYPRVSLSRPGQQQKPRLVHHLVLEAFVGPRPDDMEALHGPAGKLDASLANLHWGTRSENMRDKTRDGNDNRGERSGRAILTWEQVREIRARADAGESQRVLASDFGVTFGNIHCIVRNKSWVEQTTSPFFRDSGTGQYAPDAAASAAVRDLTQGDVPPREQGDGSERWLAVPGFEGRYEVSNRGHVRSVDRVIRGIKTRRWPGKIIAQHLSWGGYPSVGLSDFGKRWTFIVHILVLTVFAGPCPEGQEALHGPGGKLDASIGNLHWGTRQENVLDRIRDGTHNRGARHGMAKLTQAQVDEIRSRWAEGETQMSLATEFGTTPGNVCAIVRRKSWSDT
jgi:hypothetical protein